MSDQEKTCSTCQWYAPDPRDRVNGVCFDKWVDTTLIETPNGAYERTFPWTTCPRWTKREVDG